ncbi:hypothetical protein BDC45DRAFT_574933 [Circinella umbellata]|nr:hypothetical protein BDC45DRAFT_574933 [Circinella umbellata]
MVGYKLDMRIAADIEENEYDIGAAKMANCQCQLSTMHLVADAWYVAVRQFNQLGLPKSYIDLDCGMEALRALLTMESHMRKTVDKLPALESTFLLYTTTLVKPRIPDRLFKRTPFDLNTRLQKRRRTDQLESAFPSIDASKLSPDQCGWVFIHAINKYYTVVSERKSKKTNILLTSKKKGRLVTATSLSSILPSPTSQSTNK